MTLSVQLLVRAPWRTASLVTACESKGRRGSQEPAREARLSQQPPRVVLAPCLKKISVPLKRQAPRGPTASVPVPRLSLSRAQLGQLQGVQV